MNRRADHWLPRPVFTQYLPRLAVPGAAVKGQFLPTLSERLACSPHKAAALIVRCRGSYGPLSAARTRSKNSEDRPEGRHRPADWGVMFCTTLQRA
jgi:hypothetical protein